MICRNCGKDFADRFWQGKLVDYCSRSCYSALYWQDNYERKSAYFKELHKKQYIPHPKPLKYKTKEERHEAQLEYSKNYYKENKDYYKARNKIWYETHKNDIERRIKHREAMRKYYYKKKEENLNV